MVPRPFLLVIACFASACAADPVAPPADGESSSSAGAESSSSSSGDAPAGESSSEVGSDEASGPSASSSETTGAPPECGELEASVLFTSTMNVGSPPDSFLMAILSWFDPETGDYDESADDFEVPAGSCWCVSEVVVHAIYTTGSAPAEPELVVNFYDDAGDLPQTRWFSETTTLVTTTDLEGPSLRHAVELAEPVLVPAGRTWMSVVARMQDEERMGVMLSLDSQRTPSAAHLDLMDCPMFTHFEDCYPGSPATQLAFELHGTEIGCAG